MTRRLSVLVVDDEPIVGKRLEPMLTEMGCEVECFCDPNEALQRLGQRAFEIVITDVKMGEVDGLHVLEQTLEHHADAKVVMITGYATMELARRAMARGAFDFIPKPFTLDEVRSIISRAAQALDVRLTPGGEAAGG
jgi:DNA-binding NtrC family response regulator